MQEESFNNAGACQDISHLITIVVVVVIIIIFFFIIFILPYGIASLPSANQWCEPRITHILSPCSTPRL